MYLIKFEKKDRYYYVYLQPTFFENETDMVCSWGVYHNNRGGRRIIVCKSKNEIDSHLDQIIKRRTSRGYQIVPSEKDEIKNMTEQLIGKFLK